MGSPVPSVDIEAFALSACGCFFDGTDAAVYGQRRSCCTQELRYQAGFAGQPKVYHARACVGGVPHNLGCLHEASLGTLFFLEDPPCTRQSAYWLRQVPEGSVALLSTCCATWQSRLYRPLIEATAVASLIQRLRLVAHRVYPLGGHFTSWRNGFMTLRPLVLGVIQQDRTGHAARVEVRNLYL